MTQEEQLENMRRVVASHCPYAIDLYDEMVGVYLFTPPASSDVQEESHGDQTA